MNKRLIVNPQIGKVNRDDIIDAIVEEHIVMDSESEHEVLKDLLISGFKGLKNESIDDLRRMSCECGRYLLLKDLPLHAGFDELELYKADGELSKVDILFANVDGPDVDTVTVYGTFDAVHDLLVLWYGDEQSASGYINDPTYVGW